MMKKVIAHFCAQSADVSNNHKKTSESGSHLLAAYFGKIENEFGTQEIQSRV